MAISLKRDKVQQGCQMAEEAMSFIASKHFNFSEEGDYIPYNNPSRAPDHLLNTAPLNHPIPHQKLVLYPDGLYSHDDDDLYGETQTGDPEHDFNLYQWVESGQPLLDRERSLTPFEELVRMGSDQHYNSLHAPGPAVVQGPTHVVRPAGPVQVPTPATAHHPAPHAAAPVSGGGGLPSNSHTVGLSLVRNGKTFPKIEGGRERWYSQRPGHGNSYSRYSDLVSHDKAKGLTPLPKASKSELETARRQQTFG
jgi:hypothetical protein